MNWLPVKRPIKAYAGENDQVKLNQRAGMA